VAQSKALEF